ncbi:hypothetical protein [Emticicia sp. SJ17W-69]|uniref:hypothetical protein n=1 Tax=Emticicia sp. SJ17W-69 TaxID=3421657 RepID=UPI003EB797A6
MKNQIEKSVNVDLSLIADETTKSSQNVETEEEVYIYDECGDTLWDKVLAQEEQKSVKK